MKICLKYLKSGGINNCFFDFMFDFFSEKKMPRLPTLKEKNVTVFFKIHKVQETSRSGFTKFFLYLLKS